MKKLMEHFEPGDVVEVEGYTKGLFVVIKRDETSGRDLAGFIPIRPVDSHKKGDGMLPQRLTHIDIEKRKRHEEPELTLEEVQEKTCRCDKYSWDQVVHTLIDYLIQERDR